MSLFRLSILRQSGGDARLCDLVVAANAGHQPMPQAGAQRMLEAVGSMPLFGGATARFARVDMPISLCRPLLTDSGTRVQLQRSVGQPGRDETFRATV
jgi:hypothetical protein